MFKKILSIILISVMTVTLFAGCTGKNTAESTKKLSSEEMLARITQVDKSCTAEQVHKLLGEPTENPPTEIYTEIYRWDGYEAILHYLADGLTISLYDSAKQKAVTII